MSGYERNYGFADLIDCASGLNRLASMEYGEENIHFGRSHAKQQTIWGKLHPLLAGETEPDLSDFNRLQTGAEVIEALKKGFDEAQNLLIQLNMTPHTGVRNQAWWKTLWIIERELRLFERGSDTSPVPLDTECDEVGGDDADLSGPVDLWDLSTDVQGQGSDSEEDDGVDDLAVAGHETRHVMAEVFEQICSEEEEVKKFDPIVVFNGHSIYKATLVSQLVGNPTLSKDRLTRIKQSIYFNGVKQKPQVEGVPVLFNWYSPVRNSREKFTYAHTDLQWIDLESVITVVSMKMEQNVRTVWSLDANDRLRLDEFLQSL
ncbi:hypothetical protein R1sor_010615 [Riccia sorocarpa]|uniref:Uncharacterized protein n=1 Tax=Riccia sorocarpa TaxID=122646 RepID=A0ABD3I1Y7_9MARC